MVEEKTSDIKSIILHLPTSYHPPNEINKERERALKDLTKSAKFIPTENNNDPYCIDLSLEGNKFIFKIRDSEEAELPHLILSLSPYSRIIKDYFMIIDSYEQFRTHSTTAKLETIDMARRAIHNEAAEMMMERLKDKITLDLDTSRRLFTLICALHISRTKNR